MAGFILQDTGWASKASIAMPATGRLTDGQLSRFWATARHCSGERITSTADKSWAVAPLSPVLGLGALALAQMRRARDCSRSKNWRLAFRRASVAPTACSAAAPGAEAGTEFSLEDMLQSRPAHWIIRTSDPRKSLEFLREVCGMKVLRHEEHSGPCEITSNGPSDAAWSKTMVGYDREDVAFCLALTYTPSVTYSPGVALTHFALGVDNPEAALAAAIKQGYTAAGDIVTGPDGYRFRLLPHDRGDRFLYIALRVDALPRALDFYGAGLGMEDMTWELEHLAFSRGGSELMRVVGYPDKGVPLMLFEDPTEPEKSLKVQPWDGRLAFAVPVATLRGAYAHLEDALGEGNIIHSLRELDGHTGKLTVAVVRDADGYEVGMVGSEAWDKAAVEAYSPDQEIEFPD